MRQGEKVVGQGTSSLAEAAIARTHGDPSTQRRREHDTRADLDGLGASEGASITWTIPANMRRDQADGFPAAWPTERRSNR